MPPHITGDGMPSHHRTQRGQRAEADVDERDRAEIGRGRVDHLLDHPGGGQRAFEAAAADDRLLAHRGPAGEEEEDHQQREEQLDQQVRRRAGRAGPSIELGVSMRTVARLLAA